ncbi:MAG TPA: hypothetical protein VG308_03545 [Stellaceae bacterium]|nr:hypothetical protein [Stellaceae bacterium]
MMVWTVVHVRMFECLSRHVAVRRGASFLEIDERAKSDASNDALAWHAAGNRPLLDVREIGVEQPGAGFLRAGPHRGDMQLLELPQSFLEGERDRLVFGEARFGTVAEWGALGHRVLNGLASRRDIGSAACVLRGPLRSHPRMRDFSLCHRRTSSS